jgi:hypothetical protein
MQERVVIPDFLYARCFFENEAAKGTISLYTIATLHLFRSAQPELLGFLDYAVSLDGPSLSSWRARVEPGP